MPEIGLRDLDGRTLDEFRLRGVASDRMTATVAGESDGNLIELLHLREGEHLRRAAVLLFHPNPTRFFAGAFVKIGYFRAETELAYQDVVEGSLFVQVNRTVELLRTKYSKAKISYRGIFRQETPPAPSEALREAVLNAVAHRDYSNPAPIQIRVYDNRISLWNPGTLPPNWTLDKLLGTHASAPHNPGIANAFFRAGMIEAWGRGIGSIVETCPPKRQERPNQSGSWNPTGCDWNLYSRNQQNLPPTMRAGELIPQLSRLHTVHRHNQSRCRPKCSGC